jgi:L-threonylcarbamoyladenylate synthase
VNGKVIPASAPGATEAAARILAEGGLVVVPTDTVYGLAAALSRPDAVARIFVAKRRPQERAIPLLVDSLADLDQVATEIPDAARRLIERFWPGGLTLILPGRPEIPTVITAGGRTVAVRMPNHRVVRELIRRLGSPLPTTSANVHGRPSPRSAAEAAAELSDAVGLILDDGPAPGGVDSTIVDPLVNPPRILRVGAISIGEIEAAIGGTVQPPLTTP